MQRHLAQHQHWHTENNSRNKAASSGCSDISHSINTGIQRIIAETKQQAVDAAASRTASTPDSSCRHDRLKFYPCIAVGMPQYFTTHRREDEWSCPTCSLRCGECRILWVFCDARRRFEPLRIFYIHGTSSACGQDISDWTVSGTSVIVHSEVCCDVQSGLYRCTIAV